MALPSLNIESRGSAMAVTCAVPVGIAEPGGPRRHKEVTRCRRRRKKREQYRSLKPERGSLTTEVRAGEPQANPVPGAGAQSQQKRSGSTDYKERVS